MAVIEYIRELLFPHKKRVTRYSKILLKRLKRFTVKTTLTPEESFTVPIIINNRNRLTYLRSLVDWLRQAGYTNIVILDNDSAYPPLLEYYRSVDARVIFLEKNAGYMALWQTNVFQQFEKGYYVYSDADLVPDRFCPPDIVYQLYQVLKKYNTPEKCGPALRIDDLPDHYDRKSEVINNVEGRYWTRKIEHDLYDAPIDTTFALYRPFASGNAEECPAYRLGGKFVFRHMPWYENSSRLSPEAQFYKDHANESSSWYSEKKENG